VASREELLAAGVTARSIRTWTAAGHLVREHRGVYRIGPAPLTEPGRFLAAVLAAGPGAVLSHRAAGVVHGFLGAAPGRVDVTVTRRLPQRRGIRLHCVRALDPQETAFREQIPITGAARTLLDLAAVLPPRELTRAVHEAQVQRCVRVAELAAVLARHAGRAGAPRLRAVVTPGAAPTRSALEDRLLELVRQAGLPEPAVNARRCGFEVDLLFAAHRLVVEADGRRFHDTAQARVRDAEKQARLEAAGYRVIRVDWAEVTARRAQTITRLRHAIEVGVAERPEGRPQPDDEGRDRLATGPVA
jgi:very-short-patch-repair endonuclease